MYYPPQFVILPIADPEVGEVVALRCDKIDKIEMHIREDDARIAKVFCGSELIYVEESVRTVVDKVNQALGGIVREMI